MPGVDAVKVNRNRTPTELGCITAVPEVDAVEISRNRTPTEVGCSTAVPEVDAVEVSRNRTPTEVGCSTAVPEVDAVEVRPREGVTVTPVEEATGGGSGGIPAPVTGEIRRDGTRDSHCWLFQMISRAWSPPPRMGSMASAAGSIKVFASTRARRSRSDFSSATGLFA